MAAAAHVHGAGPADSGHLVGLERPAIGVPALRRGAGIRHGIPPEQGILRHNACSGVLHERHAHPAFLSLDVLLVVVLLPNFGGVDAEDTA